MPDRKPLHELIDTLPEDALETVKRVLQNYQTWPPKPPMSVEEMRKRVIELSRGRGEESAVPQSRFIGTSFTGGRTKPDGDAMVSMSTTDGESLVTLEIHVFRGHRLEIEKRLRVSEDKKSLIYTLQLKGPGGKENRYDIQLDT